MANLNFNEGSAAAQKQKWRRQLKIIRQEIDPQRRKATSELACQTLKILTQHAPFILSFASIGSEINLWPFNQALAAEGRLILPRISDQELLLFQVQDLNHLETHKWDVREPIPALCRLVDLSEIAIALIPGLGFDPVKKARLGYGGGYYDRLLSKNMLAHSWGVGFLEQAVEGLPCSPHDRRLDKILLY